jgi:signal peptidase I
MAASTPTPNKELHHLRDVIESIYIAIVLAFVLRAFLIEAFVIPTGSMANTLYGQHFDLRCPACEWSYSYGHSVGSNSVSAHCPNCGAPYQDGTVFSQSGDRVLVLKYLYNFRPPQPWDVVVFKNPQNNRENYIKRLIGTPGETIEIVLGDIFYWSEDDPTPRIRRKPPAVQQELWEVVYDNDFPIDEEAYRKLAAGKSPPAWQAVTPDAWDLTGMGGREFAFRGGKAAALRFHPGPNGFWPVNGYNTRQQETQHLDAEEVCHDFRLSCVMTPQRESASLELVLERYSDRIKAFVQTDGLVRLMRQDRGKTTDDWDVWAEGRIEAFQSGVGRTVALSYADFVATVWVDDAPVLTFKQYDNGDCYAEAMRRYNLPRLQRDAMNQGTTPRYQRLSRELDWLENPEVAVRAAAGPLTLRHVRLERDVYYSTPPVKIDLGPTPEPTEQYLAEQWRRHRQGLPTPNHFPETMHSAFGEISFAGWGTTGNPIALRHFPEHPEWDEFFCMGDNSTSSHDGRSWTSAAPSLQLYDQAGDPLYQVGTVPRYNLIGRGFMVYWPAGLRPPVVNLPIVPNVGEMRLIR